jgi:hypothetical protein
MYSMEDLNSYSVPEKELIIQLGIIAYDKCQEYILNGDNSKKDNRLQIYKLQETHKAKICEEKMQYNKLVSDMQDNNNKTISNLRNELEETYNAKINTEKSRYDDLYNKLCETRNNMEITHNTKITAENKRYDELYNELCKERLEGQTELKIKLKELEKQYSELAIISLKTLDKHESDKIMALNDKLSILTEQLDQRDKELCSLRKGSSAKGIEYEGAIYESLVDYNDNNGNIWIITHVGQQLGGKGDIIMQHKESGHRIMIDPKNHKCVPKIDKEKFLRDMRDNTNKYHGGIMVSRGKISGMMSFEQMVDGNKQLNYLSHYNKDQVNFLMLIIERLRSSLQKEADNVINISKLKDKYQNDYEYMKKQKLLCENQLKLVNNMIKQLSAEYYDYFNGDIQTDILPVLSTTTNNVGDELYNFFDRVIERMEGESVQTQEVREKVLKVFKKLNKTQPILYFNKWRKRRFNDENIVKHNTCMGYTFIDKSDVLKVDTTIVSADNKLHDIKITKDDLHITKPVIIKKKKRKGEQPIENSL